MWATSPFWAGSRGFFLGKQGSVENTAHRHGLRLGPRGVFPLCWVCSYCSFGFVVGLVWICWCFALVLGFFWCFLVWLCFGLGFDICVCMCIFFFYTLLLADSSWLVIVSLKLRAGVPKSLSACSSCVAVVHSKIIAAMNMFLLSGEGCTCSLSGTRLKLTLQNCAPVYHFGAYYQ